MCNIILNNPIIYIIAFHVKYDSFTIPIIYLFQSIFFNFLISFILNYQIILQIASIIFSSFFFFLNASKGLLLSKHHLIYFYCAHRFSFNFFCNIFLQLHIVYHIIFKLLSNIIFINLQSL